MEVMRQHKLFMQLILNVAELMSHNHSKQVAPDALHLTKQIPCLVPAVQLGSMAFGGRAFAKALRYKEAEFASIFQLPAIHSGLVKSYPSSPRFACNMHTHNIAFYTHSHTPRHSP